MPRAAVRTSVTGPDGENDILVQAFVGDVEAGRLTAGTLRGDGAVRVRIMQVDKQWRRQGVGTAMYEAAAHAACERYGLPLSSDDTRSPAAEEFWRKQERKGKAVCRLRLGESCFRYWLSCPAPRSLAGRRKR